MDYLQTLEYQMLALQRKIRLLQEFRFFVETSTASELCSFADELRTITTVGGVSVGEALASALGAGSSGSPNALPQGLQAAPASSQAAPAPAGARSRAPASGPPGLPAAERETVAAVPGPGPLPAAAAGAMSGALPAAGPASDLEPAAGRDSGERDSALALAEAGMKPIPAGSFLMGAETNDDEKPVHKVGLKAFRMCDHLVTNKEYSLFVHAQPAWSKDRADPGQRDEQYLFDWDGDRPPEGKEDHPVAFVSRPAALAYAAWLGKRLPTEAEWEYAARGGLVGKKFPGGDQMNDKLANLAKQYRGTTATRTFEPNGYGLYDMAGNLFEWTSDWYARYEAGEASDPRGPMEGEYAVVRGGSWMSGAGALRVSARVDMDPLSCGQVGIRLVD